MKKVFAGILVIALVLVAAPAFAQDEEITYNFGIKAGWFFWTEEDLTDNDVDNSWIVGADATMWMDSGLGFGVGANFLKKTVDVEGTEFEWDVMEIPLNADVYFRMPMENDGGALYIGAGPSLVLLDVDLVLNNVSYNADDKAFGFNAVAGFEFDNFFVEGQYLWTKAEFEIEGLETDKVQYGGFSFFAGYRF